VCKKKQVVYLVEIKEKNNFSKQAIYGTVVAILVSSEPSVGGSLI
jgi:hypothetical protein